MKRILVPLLVVMLLLGSVSPVLADYRSSDLSTGQFRLTGTITAINPLTKTVTVRVMNGNPLVQPYIGKTLKIQASVQTRYQLRQGTTLTSIKFANLTIGDHVTVNGMHREQAWNAWCFTVGPKFSLVGEITLIDPLAKTVTVKVFTGNILVKSYINKELMVQTTDKTRFLLKSEPTAIPITFSDLKLGDKVSVNGVLKDSIWTAGRITVIIPS